MNPVADLRNKSYGCKLTYRQNVLHCTTHRTFAENYDACLQALALLEGCSVAYLLSDAPDSIAAVGGTVEAYRSYGGGTP